MARTRFLEPVQQALSDVLLQVEVVVLLIWSLQIQRNVLEHQDVLGFGFLHQNKTNMRDGFSSDGRSEKQREAAWMLFYRRGGGGGGGSAQLLLQPSLLGLLQLRAGRGVVEELRVQDQAQDSAHLQQQHPLLTPHSFLIPLCL